MGQGANGNEFRQVLARKQPLPKTVRQEFRTETDYIIRRLKFLLPDYRTCVGTARYAKDKNTLALLTACCSDDLLDIYALEQSLVDLTHLQADFVLALDRQLGANK